MSIDWNWGIFLQQAPFGNTTYLGWLWSGFQVTVALSITAWIIAFLVGSLFGILRTVPNRFLSTLGTLYVELFRNVPLIVQFFTWYLVIPELLPDIISYEMNDDEYFKDNEPEYVIQYHIYEVEFGCEYKVIETNNFKIMINEDTDRHVCMTVFDKDNSVICYAWREDKELKDEISVGYSPKVLFKLDKSKDSFYN